MPLYLIRSTDVWEMRQLWHIIQDIDVSLFNPEFVDGNAGICRGSLCWEASIVLQVSASSCWGPSWFLWCFGDKYICWFYDLLYLSAFWQIFQHGHLLLVKLLESPDWPLFHVCSISFFKFGAPLSTQLCLCFNLTTCASNLKFVFICRMTVWSRWLWGRLWTRSWWTKRRMFFFL